MEDFLLRQDFLNRKLASFDQTTLRDHFMAVSNSEAAETNTINVDKKSTDFSVSTKDSAVALKDGFRLSKYFELVKSLPVTVI